MSRSRYRPASPVPLVGSPILLGSGYSWGESMTDVIDNRGGENPCHHTSCQQLTDNGALKTYPAAGGYKPSVVLASGLASSRSSVLGSPTSALVRLKQQYVTEIASQGRSDFQAISFLREITETYQMLRNPFKLIGHLRHSPIARRANRHTKLKSVVKAAEDTWLEGTYGWQPFVYDMLSLGSLRSCYQARRALLKSPPRRFAYRTTSRQQTVYTASPSGRPFVYSGYDNVTMRAKYYGQWRTNPSIASENALASLARCVNIDRLGYAAWDAVPYSFVVDWFFPLGDYVDDLLSGPAFVQEVSIPWLSLSTEKLCVRELAPGPKTAQYNPSGGGTYIEKGTIFDRYQASILDLDVEDYKTGMHGTRIPSAIALGHGALERIRNVCKLLR